MPKRLTKKQIAYNNNIPLDLSLPKTLKDAVIKRDYKSVKRLLQNGANPNEQDSEGLSSLHFATKDNRLYIIRLLLHYGASPILKDNNGHNCFDYALEFNATFLKNLFERKLNAVNHRNFYNFFAHNEAVVPCENNENDSYRLNFNE